MATVTKKQYEGMFLIDTAICSSDWDGVIAEIETMLKKADAEVISIRKWDERRLAYDIQKKSRGTYILAYFRCDGPKIQDMEKAVQLSEKLMRVLILNVDHMTQEDMEKDTPAIKAEKNAELRKTSEQEDSGDQDDDSVDDTEDSYDTDQEWDQSDTSTDDDDDDTYEDVERPD